MFRLLSTAVAVVVWPLTFVSLQSCASNESDTLSMEELDDFSELAALAPKPDKVVAKKNAPTAESVLHRMRPVEMTTGQASGIIYGTCVSHDGVDYLSKELDTAVLQAPDILKQTRIGFDPDHFTSNQVSFFVFDTKAEAQAAQKVVFKRQKSAQQRDPAVFLSCDQTNMLKAPIVQHYVELYLNAPKYHSLAAGIAALVDLRINTDSNDAKRQITEWHQAAAQMIKAHPRIVALLDKRTAVNMTSADEILARSFAAYIVGQYSMQKAVATATYTGKKDGYANKLGSDFIKIRTAWLKKISGKSKFARRISRR